MNRTMGTAAMALVMLSGCSSSDSTATKGPGAALKCSSSQMNAFDTYHSAGFVAANEAIFAAVGAEIAANMTTHLGDSFTKIGTGTPPSTKDDAPTFKGNLAAFLVYVYGGPTSIMYTDGKTYQGVQDMVGAHTGLGITGPQYDYFVASIVVPALTSVGVTSPDVSSCFAPPLMDATFKASIVGH